MDDTNAPLRPLAGAPAPAVAVDVGQVYEMKMPADFVLGMTKDGVGSNSFFQEYHSQSDPDVKIYFEYRGRRMTQQSADIFFRVLAEPAHNVPQAELEKLRELLLKKANPAYFRTLVAKTQDVKGRRVLVTEGVYLTHNLQARTIYIDCENNGSVVQEITFQAPVDRFIRHVLQGQKALESIVWK